MSLVSTAISRLYSQNNKNNGGAGKLIFSTTKILIPDNTFVLCKDENGFPTAIFESNLWSFQPISTTPYCHGSTLRFQLKSSNEIDADYEEKLIYEVKRLILMIIYLVPKSGKFGSISIKTLQNRFSSLMKIANFCVTLNSSRGLVTNLTLQDVLSNPSYLAAHIKMLSTNEKSELSNLLKNLQKIRQENIGYKVQIFHKSRPSANQTPLIPLPIYLQAFKALHDEINFLWSYRTNIKSLICEFSAPHVGIQKRRLIINGFTHTDEVTLNVTVG